MRAAVLNGFGINCEVETAAALRMAGAEVDTVHLNRVLLGKASIRAFDLVVFPGGFSFGDDLGSGRVLASKLRFARLPSGRRLVDELDAFLADGGRLLGICNGFQILVKAGLLPFGSSGGFVQQATLAPNDSGRFEDRWVRLRVNPKTPAAWLRTLGVFEAPVRHGEGKVVLASAVRARVEASGLDALSYVDEDGQPTERYPENPNGSSLGCAGLTDPSGQVLGLMPHPEAFLSPLNHPAWPSTKRREEWIETPKRGQGYSFFAALVDAGRGV
ncbi:MAG: phosphoribosylformylglycinamidine synthase subunit PurQ [Deltaproteobacteria bacterium]|nr:phosphoribosylformylglycinamidine synthase subunit PurQ [Deltaproteobacteria bacterium]